MNNRSFPNHGAIKMRLDDGLLVIEGRGPANIETVNQYQRSAQAFRDKLNHAPWASLVLLKGEPLLPPEAKHTLLETIKFACTQNLVATAVVLCDISYERTVKHFWTSIYDETPLKYAFFNDQQEAKQWLLQQVESHSSKTTFDIDFDEQSIAHS